MKKSKFTGAAARSVTATAARSAAHSHSAPTTTTRRHHVLSYVKEAVTGDMPRCRTQLDVSPLAAFLDTALRGVSMVVFASNPLTGVVLLAAVTLASAWLGVTVMVGVFAATAAAKALRLERDSCRQGFFGYNGAITGAGLGTFLAPEWDLAALALVAVAAALTAPVMAVLLRAMTDVWGVRPLTLPFNLVMLGFVAALVSVERGHAGLLIGHSSKPVATAVDSTLRSTPDGGELGLVTGVAEAVIHGAGQLFFLPGTMSGLLVLLSLALCSRLLASLAVLGSVTAVASAQVIGVDGFLTHFGLVGMNGLLVCLAVGGVCLRPSVRSVALGVAGAALSPLGLVALAPLVALFGMPTAMSLPFCLIVPVLLLLHETSPALKRA
ncbi:urea transporter [Actinomadura sp. B10D3]|uniref:urea transporter n=1 Tax=Actinomadura sp. B10D3 TaxID=3153557 RepID=UPI00325C394E